MELVYPSTVTEITVSYIHQRPLTERPEIISSADAHQILLKGYNQDTLALQEQFLVLFLNQANQLLGLYRLATGGRNGVISDPRLIFAVALKIAAVACIVSHSHPSGVLRPSRADEEMTAKLQAGGKVLDIKVLDHIIVSSCKEQYYSFADNGRL